MTLYRKCDACGHTSSICLGWMTLQGITQAIDLCSECSDEMLGQIRERRRNAHVMQTHDPND